MNWHEMAKFGDLRSVIDPADKVGHKNRYINILQHIVLADAMGDLKGLNVLDVGCGLGRFEDLFVDCKYTGVDSCPEMDPNVVAKCDDLPFEDATFDVVLSVWMLQYQENLDVVAKELKRVLKPDGRIFMIEQLSEGYDTVLARDHLDYIMAFRQGRVNGRPILKSGDILVGVIKRGFVPERLFPVLARVHLMLVKWTKTGQYVDCLMVYRR